MKQKAPLMSGAHGTQSMDVKKSTVVDIPKVAVLLWIDDKQVGCMFCARAITKTGTVLTADKMSLKERERIVPKRKTCCSCWRLGLGQIWCKANLKCEHRKGRHTSLLCRKASRSTKEATKLEVSCLAKEGPAISTYLPTLVVKIKGNGQKEKTVRALINYGSQRSHVLERVAEEKERLLVEISRNCLFGGIVGSPTRCCVFRIDVYDLAEATCLNLGEKEVCDAVPSLD